ncbi:hypothetical protein BOTBODRAFT_31473 [Botryobasidium botryosum FD-172 SS1]|uniref:Uncharacterized protein n=1 Tax=Botryobasidium botryosum (strain FD-172 SS1) TaxID=930990 RepID=A0A067MLH1_BOTB1|nr:hypothetical protein BOTBODRAFT_31473 [Botryobasidium botryosum FD-172 SS1]
MLLQSVIQSRTQELALVEEEITKAIYEVEQIVNAQHAVPLWEKGQMLEVRRNRIRSGLAPINCLPVELLSQIFVLGFLDEFYGEEKLKLVEDAKDEDDDEADLEFSTLVTHVCHHWREVALQTPSMWTYLEMVDNYPAFEKTMAWIERSKACLLEFDLDFSSEYYEDFGRNEMNVVLDLIMPHIARWCAFSLIVDAFEPMHTFLARMQAPAPNLRELELYNNAELDTLEAFSPPHLRTPIKLPHNVAPKLERFSVWSVHILWPVFPFTNLIHLELAYHTPDVRPSWGDFIGMLNASPNLRSLALIDSWPPLSSYAACEGPTVQLPSVVEFKLVLSSEPPDLIHLINTLRMPNLRKLHLGDLIEANFAPFIKAIGGPPAVFPLVESLTIFSITCDDTAAFTHMFFSFPNLQYLDVDCDNLDPSLLYSLVGVAGRSDLPRNTLCPKLSTIKCTGLNPYVRSFVEGRLAAGAASIIRTKSTRMTMNG